MNGILNLNKPANISSARAVSRVKYLLPRGIKVGHAGTLDPFATGVLLILIGPATRLCEKLMDQPKKYLATMKLGATTVTNDCDSPELPGNGIKPVSENEARAILPAFTGLIQQQPPAFSALKVGGKRAYQLARDGRPVALTARPVMIYSLDMLRFDWPFMHIRVACGRGTYIRALARDIGSQLGVGGYLTELSRTAVGDFSIETAIGLEELSIEKIITRLVLPNELKL